MASVLIKNLPDALHQQLKQRAERHHRSLNKEVIALIEAALTNPQAEDASERVASLRDPRITELLDEVQQRRAARVLALQGKYRTSISSSDEFADRKAEGIALER
ncbi:FitA-like ribbon-helix-helix domain-containing protein [Methylolobus aquaticus]